MGICREKVDWMAHHSKGHHSSFKYLKKMMNRFVRHLSFEESPTHKSTCKFYRGWVTVLAFMMSFVTSCGEQGFSIDVGKPVAQEDNPHLKEASSDSVQYYFDQARLGIGDAYVKMAQYYLDGTLGKPNLLNVMTMESMAEEYKAIPNMATLFKNISGSDDIKIAFQALDMLNHTESDDSILARSKNLLGLGIPEGFLMQAIVLWKKGNREDAIAYCNRSILGGSVIADVFRDIIAAGEGYGGDLKPETLLKIVDRFPMAYRLLGDHYAKIPNDSAIDIPLAREYYLKASDYACLGRRGARWVLETIYIKGYPAVDSLIEKRLWSLYRQEINDSVIWLD